MTMQEREAAGALVALQRSRAHPGVWKRLSQAALMLTVGKLLALACCGAPVGALIQLVGVKGFWADAITAAFLAGALGLILSASTRAPRVERLRTLLLAGQDLADGKVEQVDWRSTQAWFVASDPDGIPNVVLDIGDGQVVMAEFAEGPLRAGDKAMIPGADNRPLEVPLEGSLVVLPRSKLVLAERTRTERLTLCRRFGCSECIDTWNAVRRTNLSADLQAQLDAPIRVERVERPEPAPHKRTRPGTLRSETAHTLWFGLLITVPIGAIAGSIFAWFGGRLLEAIGVGIATAALLMLPVLMIAGAMIGVSILGTTLGVLFGSLGRSSRSSSLCYSEQFHADRWAICTRPGVRDYAAACWVGDLAYLFESNELGQHFNSSSPGSEVTVIYRARYGYPEIEAVETTGEASRVVSVPSIRCRGPLELSWSPLPAIHVSTDNTPRPTPTTAPHPPAQSPP